MATLALTGYTSAYYGALALGGQTCRPVRPVSCTTAGPPNTRRAHGLLRLRGHLRSWLPSGTGAAGAGIASVHIVSIAVVSIADKA